MTHYILKRLSMMVLTLFLIILLTFILMHSIPGGPFTRDKPIGSRGAGCSGGKIQFGRSPAGAVFRLSFGIGAL